MDNIQYPVTGSSGWGTKINNNFKNISDTIGNINSQLNENVQQLNNVKTDLSTNYAKKTDVNDLATNKAEKVDLDKKYSKEDIQNNIGFGDINKNISKIDETMISDELKQQIAGNAGVSSVSKESITTDKLAEKSVTYSKIPMFDVKGNLFNKLNVTSGNYVNPENGNLVTYTGYNASEYIEINGNTIYTVSHKHNIAFYDSEKNYISGIEQNETSANGTVFTFTTPSNARYIRLSIKDVFLNYFSFNKGNEIDDSDMKYTFEKLDFNKEENEGNLFSRLDSSIIKDKYIKVTNNRTI